MDNSDELDRRRARDAARKRAKRRASAGASADVGAPESLFPQGPAECSATSVPASAGAANDAEPTTPHQTSTQTRTFATLSDAVEAMTPEEKRALVARSLGAHDVEVERRGTELDKRRRERSRAEWAERNL